ncbi:MAG: hypothetical protein ACOC8E_05275 [Planctomycetota bacterium]
MPIRVILVALPVLCLGLPAEGSDWREPLQDRLGFLGEDGTIDVVYKVDTTSPARFHRLVQQGKVSAEFEVAASHGAELDAMGRPTGPGEVVRLERVANVGEPPLVQIARTRVMEVRQLEAGTFEYVYRSDRVVPLRVEDGLVSGQVERVIHAGRAVRVNADNRILGVDGVSDTLRVLSKRAQLRLDSRVITLSRGEYTGSVLHPLWGKWSRVRVIGAYLTIAGALMLIVSFLIRVPGRRPRRRPTLFWTTATLILIAGIVLFVLDFRLVRSL